MNGISADFGFENFYGGLEPASDQETRFLLTTGWVLFFRSIKNKIKGPDLFSLL